MSRRSNRRRHVDLTLLAIVAALLGFGVISVYSSSYAYAQHLTGRGTYFFIHQIIWAALGLGAMIVAAVIDYGVWRRFAIPIMLVVLLLLGAVLMIPGELHGARRTLLHGHVQPSELAKVAMIIYIASWLASREKMLQDVRLGLVTFAVLL
ncbi:MAG: FtsW/RodA/SpoVE family cell cycle protein, partial [Anaerolineae bacterium]|nr:FtsW/RodA/SpoVE family cell cycle protein [Anaerolineae bacterium]